MRDSRPDGRVVRIDGGFPGGRQDAARIAAGVALVIVGTGLLVAARSGIPLSPLARWWPAILLAIGGIRLFGPARRRWVGFWLATAGVYGAIGEWKIGGLEWRGAWPVFVIAAGLAILGRTGRRPWLGTGTARRG